MTPASFLLALSLILASLLPCALAQNPYAFNFPLGSPAILAS